jgi:flagellar hook-basal body complex protein FliE
VSAILPISAPVLPQPVSPAGAAGASKSGFQEAMASAIQAVESTGRQASGTVERFLNGEGEELHTTLLAAERAQLTFDLFIQARNKVVSAYQEIMRMQM